MWPSASPGTGCGGGATSTPPGTGQQPTTGTPIDRNDWTAAAIANLGAGYAGVQGVWAGFDPGEHPSVAVYRSGAGAVRSALAINFPSPGKLGDAAELSVAGRPFKSLHLITNLEAGIERKFREIENFEFSIDLGGVDSFVMIAGEEDDFFDPSEPDWASTFIHEMFHRYQIMRFADDGGGQDIENYAFDAGNIAMAALEERALKEGLATDDAATREAALRRFAAIRMARLGADRRVVLDNEQERSEGTARYIEHRMAGRDTRFDYHEGNHGAELLEHPDALLGSGQSIKAYYAFLRFYATGSAILRALDLLGATGVDRAVEGGKFPAEVLIEHLGVERADVSRLVSEARAAYDPGNELPAAAARAAAAAAREGPVFEDAGGNARSEGYADAAARAGRIARAERILEAIGSGSITDADIALTGLPDPYSGVRRVTAERDRAGGIAVDVNGSDENEYGGGEVRAGSGAWNGIALTRTRDDGSDDTVVIYTDIDAPADKVPDSSYAWFGWWLNAPKANTAAHKVEAFAGGTGGHRVDAAAAIEGSASYRGVAAGVYATRTFAGGVQTDATAGRFTAVASLSAEFGDGNAAGSIDGTITRFVLDGTTPVGWRVVLDGDDDVTDGLLGTTEADFGDGLTDTEGGGAGRWQGAFYGAGATAADAPTTVVGTFGAATAAAGVKGGFGATKQ